MEIAVVDLADAPRVRGVAVVVDVLRAFTTAAVALARGAREVVPVRTAAEGDALRGPDVVLVGEDQGIPLPGWDHGNSPSALEGLDLAGVRVVQRTTAGTQGLHAAAGAEAVLAASFAVAGATARWLTYRHARAITFVNTGARVNSDGDEDAACIDYLRALLTDPATDAAPYLDRVRRSSHGREFGASPHFPAADLDRCTRADTVGFALLLDRASEPPALRAAHPSPGTTRT